MRIPEAVRQFLAAIAFILLLGIIVFVVMAVFRARPGILNGHPEVATSSFRGPTEEPWTNGPSGLPPGQ